MSRALSNASGFIAINKPKDISSFDVIRRLRKITSIRKIGHSGTLDPFATGLLVCCIGSYTRLAKFIEADAKTYVATIKLGQQSETGDTEGNIIAEAPLPGSDVDFAALAHKVMQLTELPVPAYSAVKINGTRAYTLARSGVELDMPMRSTTITDISFIPYSDESYISPEGLLSYRCTVSKGTYIRSLSEWIARELNTLGHTVTLERVAVGNITLASAVNLVDLTPDNWQNHLISPQFALQKLPCCFLEDDMTYLIETGRDIPPPPNWPDELLLCAIYNKHEHLLAIGCCAGDSIHPIIVLNHEQ
jgi:tRNA pseudouridine55 synthase